MAARDAQRDDHDGPRGLRRDRAREGPEGPPGDDAGTRPATRSCRRSPASRPSSRAPSAVSSSSRYVFSYPGVGLTIQQAALGHDYAARAGAPARARVLRAPRQLHHGLRLRRPRSAGAIVLMGELSHDRAPAGGRAGRRSRRGAEVAGAMPEPIRLLLRTAMSAFGIVLLVGILLVTVARAAADEPGPDEPALAPGPAAVVGGPVRDDRPGLQRLRPGHPRWAYLARSSPPSRR